MGELKSRAAGLLALALGLAVGPDLVERARTPALYIATECEDVRCVWLSGQRPILREADRPALAAVPELGPELARRVHRALVEGAPASWSDLDRRVGAPVSRVLRPFFRWTGSDGRNEVGEDGT